jgi:hypothetical protein
MHKVALVIGLAAILAFPAFAENKMLDGTYKLISATRKIVETGQVVDSFGEHPTGYINYGKDGRFLVLIVYDKTIRPSPDSVANITDAQRAELFRTMTSYGGTYTFDGHTMQHHIDISWNQAWTGTTVVRDVEKENDKLIYTTRPAPFAGDGKMSVVTLVWQKAD